MRKNIVLILTALSYSTFIMGQGFDLNKTYPSPDVAALGNYGLMPANPFNGQANVSIPLYNIKYKDLSIPMTIQYSTAGNKPDEHPGSLGLGWNLQAGGVIYRKVNGIYDEHIITDNAYTNEICYYYNCGKISDNFNNIPYIVNYASVPTADYVYDGMPDEFVFNFNGYSGTFYITRPYDNGPVELKIKPNGDYRLRAEIVEIKDHITFNDFLNTTTNTFQTRMTDRNIYTIKMTDDAGNKYYFGNDPNAIEFSFNADPRTPPLPTPAPEYSNPAKRDMGMNTIASAWHLTKIESPNGYDIQLNYSKKGRVYTYSKQWKSMYYSATTTFTGNTWLSATVGSGVTVSNNSGSNPNVQIQNPAYLESIITPLQTVTLNFSPTSQLGYTSNINSVIAGCFENTEFSPGAAQSSWQKLTLISVSGLEKIFFSYTDDPAKRLKLNQFSIVPVGSSGPATNTVYNFTYDPLMLPAYISQMTDHWGYFNGRVYPYNNIDYLTIRNADGPSLHAEMLTKITYPTGGYLELEYEPHSYHKITKQFPFSVETQTDNPIAGGLRIRKMTTRPNANEVAQTKEYLYTTDYMNNGTNSSGVLSGVPEYENEGSARSYYRQGNFWDGAWGTGTAVLNYAFAVDNNFLQLGTTNGNNVTYSEVTEKTGQGYTVYKYTNHDNGFADELPFVMVSNFDSKWHEEGFISHENFRGSLTNMKVYNEAKDLVKDMQYQYNVDLTSSSYTVPYFYRSTTPVGGANLKRVSSCQYYIKPPLLKSTTTTDYSGTYTLVTTNESKYIPDVYPSIAATNDNFKPVEISTTSSKGDVLTTKSKYPINFAGTAVYDAMIARNIVSPVIEQKSFKNSTQLQQTVTNFALFNTASLALPSNIQSSILSNALETKIQNNAFDIDGTLLEQQPANNIKESFIWDYFNQFPIADVRNSDVGNCAATSFEANGKGNFTFIGTATAGTAVTGKMYYTLTSSTSITKVISSAKEYVVSLWATSSNVLVNSAGPVRTGKTINGYTLYEYKVTGSSLVTVSSTGANIDELRLYPKGAQVITFTYDPLKGMTTQCDVNNKILYYEYEGLGRLAYVRDDDNKILKKYCYNFYGQPENCGTVTTLYYNTAISYPYTTQGCPPGSTPTTVMYTVPAGTYFSTTDQAHAQQLAEDDRTANGQAYANKYGGCAYPGRTACSGVNMKYIGAGCEEGVKVYTSSYTDPETRIQTCTYHYEWSDNSWSPDYQEITTNDCTVVAIGPNGGL